MARRSTSERTGAALNLFPSQEQSPDEVILQAVVDIVQRFEGTR